MATTDQTTGWTVPPAPGSSVPGSSASDLSAPAAALVQAVAALREQDPTELPGPQALIETSLLLSELEKLHALALSRVADVENRQLHVLDGAASVGAWVAQQQTSVDRSEVALARRLASFPHLDDTVREGRLSVEVAARVARALTQLRRHVDRPDGLIDGQPGDEVVTAVVVDGVRQLVCEARAGLADVDPLLVWLTASLAEVACRPVSQLARLEAGFVLLARHIEPTLLPSALARLVDAVLPNQHADRVDDAHARRGFGLRRNDDGSGWTITDRDLDLETGELLHAVLQAELAVDEDNPADTEGYEQLRAQGWQSGDDLPPSGGPRSRRQRQHDALRNGLRRYLDSGIAGLRDKVAPHLGVSIGIEALHGAPGALPGLSPVGTSVPAGLVRRWCCDSAVTRFVLSLGRKVIEVSHTERTLKAHERRAKHVETGGRCQAAGCRCGPGRRLRPHHVDAFAACGTTSLSDTALLCDQSHDHIHVGGRTIRLRDGRWLNAQGWTTGP